MSKSVANVEKIIASKIEIGVSTAEAEPTSYTGIGFFGEKVVSYKLEAQKKREGGGSNIQTGYDCSVEVEALEVLNASVLEASFQNRFVWLKVTPTGTPSSSNPIVRFKNFICNMGIEGDLSAKGGSMLKISGEKYVSSITDFKTTAAS